MQVSHIAQQTGSIWIKLLSSCPLMLQMKFWLELAQQFQRKYCLKIWSHGTISTGDSKEKSFDNVNSWDLETRVEVIHWHWYLSVFLIKMVSVRNRKLQHSILIENRFFNNFSINMQRDGHHRKFNGQRRIVIWIKLVDLKSPVLFTKFQGFLFLGSE